MERSNDVYIRKMIESHPVETLHIKGRLANGGGKIYLDSSRYPGFFLLEHEAWYAPFALSETALLQGLNGHDMGEKADFCGLPMALAQGIIKGLEGYRIDWEEQCALYHLPKEKWGPYMKNHVLLDSLTAEDLGVVYDYYAYKDEDGPDYLLACIRKGPSSVIRNDEGQPISWALMREDGSLGVMYTLEDKRKQGLAKEVAKDLIKKVVALGCDPYVHIVVGNTASRQLAQSLGMIYGGDVLWFGMVKC